MDDVTAFGAARRLPVGAHYPDDRQKASSHSWMVSVYSLTVHGDEAPHQKFMIIQSGILSASEPPPQKIPRLPVSLDLIEI